MLGTVLNHYN